LKMTKEKQKEERYTEEEIILGIFKERAST